jgi:hypothetical protein
MQRGRAMTVPDELFSAVNTGPELVLYDRECIYSFRCGVSSGKNSLQEHLPDSTAGSLSRMLKEQKARLYIIRRCVAMLVCHRDSMSDQ